MLDSTVAGMRTGQLSFSQVVDVAAGPHNVALVDTAGRLFAAGSDAFLPAASGPVSAGFLSVPCPPLRSVQVGRSVLGGLTTDGELLVAGDNCGAVLADGPDVLPPTRTGLFPAAWVALDDVLFAACENGLFAVGDAPAPVRTGLAVRRMSDRVFSMLAASRRHVVALDGEGGVWGWGLNDRGQLSRSLPGRVPALSRVAAPDVGCGLAADVGFSALVGDGALWVTPGASGGWERVVGWEGGPVVAANGALVELCAHTPPRLLSGHLPSGLPAGVVRVTGCDGGWVALDAGGLVWVAGLNVCGRFGLPGFVDPCEFVQLPADAEVAEAMWLLLDVGVDVRFAQQLACRMV